MNWDVLVPHKMYYYFSIYFIFDRCSVSLSFIGTFFYGALSSQIFSHFDDSESRHSDDLTTTVC